MNKKILMPLICLLIVFSSGVFAEDFPILDKQVEIRQDHIQWITSIQEVSMEAVIDYIDEISNGTGTSELSSLLSDFQDQTALIGTLTTHIALNNALKQLKDITTDFRTETIIQMNDFNGVRLTLSSRIKTAVEANQDELDALKDTYWETRKTNRLAIFDIRVERAQNITDKLTGLEYNTTETQEKLDEIKDKRTDLENALDERDNGKIHQVSLEILDLSKELRTIVRNLQIQIPQETRVQYWIRVGERVVERTETIISELETLGLDVSELKEIHLKAEADLKEAQDAFDAGNIEGAIDALHDLKADLIDLRDAYDELISGGELSGDVETKVELTSDALSTTITEMEDSI